MLAAGHTKRVPGVGVDRQDLEPQSQNTEIQGCEIVSVAACTQRRAETTERTVRSNDAIQGPDPHFVCFRASWPAHTLTAATGTNQRSALPRQPHQVSEGKLTCQRGSWQVAATAACDPLEKFIPFTFRPETAPTIRTLALCRFLQIAAYNTEQISRRSQRHAPSLRPPSWRRKSRQ